MSGIIKKFRDKLIKDNSGMSIISVIVAVGFVCVLVSIILTTSVVNYKMRSVNAFSKDSFYSAEQVLDEIKVGLQQLSADSLSSAYVSVLKNYADEDMSSSAKNELVKVEFFKNIETQLGYQGKGGKYIAMPVDGSSEGLYKYLKDATQWHPATSTEDYGYGAFLRGNKLEGDYYVGEMLEYQNEGIYLKDLVVYYQDGNGFVSAIKTDIHLAYPGFNFSNPVMPDISSFCFVTDTKLEQKNLGVLKGSAYSTTVKGDSYAYSIDMEGVNLDFIPSDSTSETHIVASEINMKSGKITTHLSTRLWAEDITVNSSNLNLDGKTYVKDDIDVRGKDSNINMIGEYYGYSNSYTNGDASSAILINGKDAVLDFTYVKKLVLAGRSFADTRKLNADSPNTDSDSGRVYFGSSISGKSEQMMYLIPAECIGVPIEGGDSIFGKNPIELSQYNYLLEHRSEYQEVAMNKKINMLGAGEYTLGDFLDSSDVANSIEKVYTKNSDGSQWLISYYMVFESPEKANQYFAQYYGTNKDSVDKYLDLYIDSIKFPDSRYNNVSLMVNMGGYALGDDAATGERARVNTLKDTSGTVYNIQEIFDDEFRTFSTQFEGYTTKLTPDADNLQDAYAREGDNKAVYENIVNSEALKEIVDGSTSVFAIKDTAGKNRVLLIYDPETDKRLNDVNKASTETEFKTAQKNLNDYLDANVKNIDLGAYGSDVNLIVTNGSISLSGATTFKGTIIARGKIVLPSTFAFEAKPKAVEECMLLFTDDTNVFKVSELFEDSSEIEYLTEDKSDDPNTGISELVEFSNWTKNVEIN